MPKTGAEELRSIMDKSGPEVRIWLRANVLGITGANRELRSLEASWVGRGIGPVADEGWDDLLRFKQKDAFSGTFGILIAPNTAFYFDRWTVGRKEVFRFYSKGTKTLRFPWSIVPERKLRWWRRRLNDFKAAAAVSIPDHRGAMRTKGGDGG
ncbi:hypothetical protein Nepgr_008186 [Nepenthes gracilis]|uniref:Uncharacterized protein n=1 Tax=Nepenthes gracilis TaxID=150966 RepID=A0AAD3XJ75_NEPGR|nr:hypothetical protein Nepgr_008186 [Nepenthes gracilis]